MWNAAQNPVPRHHVIDTAVMDLENELGAIFEEGPSGAKVRAAIAILNADGYLFQVYGKRFIEALFNPGFDPATRYRAGEAALDLIKRRLGYL